jgi:hypothetical protein
MRDLSHLPDRPAKWHTAIIASVVASYPEPTYIEIGVLEGANLSVVLPFCAMRGGLAHGVDITFEHLRYDCNDASLWEMPSREFWPKYDEKGGGPADVIFIDGDHSFEESSADAQEALLRLADGGTLILHDTWPQFDDDTDERICGGVYRTVEQIDGDREFGVFTMQVFPGLTFVNRRQLPFGAGRPTRGR